MSLQGYRNGPATQGSALFGASQLGASQDAYGFTQDLNFTQDGTASFSDYPQFTGLSQVDARTPCFELQYAHATIAAPRPLHDALAFSLTLQRTQRLQDGSGADWGDGLSQATAVVCAALHCRPSPR